MSIPVLEKQATIVIYGFSLFSTNDIWRNLLFYDRFHVWEGLFIHQSDKSEERLCLSVVRRRCQEKKIWTCGREKVSKFISGNFAGRTCNTVSLINDDKVPSTVDNGVDTFFVVLFNPLFSPTNTFFQRLDRIHRRDDLIKLSINIIIIRYLADGIVILWKNDPELLTELFFHFNVPLRYQTSRTHNKDPLDKASCLELLNNQARLNGLSKTYFIGKDIADVIVTDRTIQDMKLMWERDNPA